jgi:iron(III) transport system permease protein
MIAAPPEPGAAPETGTPPATTAWRRADAVQWLVIAASTATIVYLALVPLGFLLWQSVGAPPGGGAGGPTLMHFRDAFARPATARLVANSLAFAVGTAVIAFTIGTTLAWLNERTNAPFKRLCFALSVLPLIVPGVLFAVAWMLLASPKIGLINVALRGVTGAEATIVDIYSLPGMTLVAGLHYSPLAFLMMTAALRAMDPALEEAALVSGAGAGSVALRITLGLAWPAATAALLVLFVRALESFEVPALLGLPAGIHVFTSAIYRAIHRYPSDIGVASAYGVCLLLVTAAGLWLQSRLRVRGARYATVAGRATRRRALDLGRWRPAAGALLVLYFMLIIGLPFLVLLWSSFQRFYAVPSLASIANLSVDAYRSAFGYPSVARAALNSVALAAGTATTIMLLTTVTCWVVVKSRAPGRTLLDVVASSPIVFPGIVLGLSIMVFYLHVDAGIYGTLWILFVAYVTRFMPYGIRYNTGSMLTIHRELEESAAMSGASWWATFRYVVLPLLRPGLVAGWIYIAIVSMRELSSSILLYGPDSQVLSVVIWELWENGQYVELSALGVLLIGALLVLVLAAQRVGDSHARVPSARVPDRRAPDAVALRAPGAL